MDDSHGKSVGHGLLQNFFCQAKPLDCEQSHSPKDLVLFTYSTYLVEGLP